MVFLQFGGQGGKVALLAEGVDRNVFYRDKTIIRKRRPPRGGRG